LSVYHYHLELFDTSQESNVTLATFILKAWEIRQEVSCARYGRRPDVPDYIKTLQDLMLPEDSTAAIVIDMPFESAVPAMRSQRSDTETSHDQFFR
jgi:hypothetical protein